MLDERIELQQAPRAAAGLHSAGAGRHSVGNHVAARGKIGRGGADRGAGLVYYIGLAACISLAQQGTLTPAVAVWLPDVVFAVFGLAMIARLEKPGDRDIVGRIIAFVNCSAARNKAASRAGPDRPRAWAARIPLLPQVIDTYVLTSFLFYFVLLVTSFVLIFHVFTFFELLSDIIRNHRPMDHVLSYHFFLTPRLIYDFTPFGVLAAVLVCFGVLTKHNEITAFKACGISVYRLTVPVLVAGLLLSGGLFAFDHYWVPDADRRQDALRNQIKGKAPQTYLRPERKWIYGCMTAFTTTNISTRRRTP